MSGHVAPLRRHPVQHRSAQRVERMLEACAALIDEVGYDGVTTTLIAERAGVAVGSLYQFFPDKRAVIHALAQRHLERFMTAVNKRFETSKPRHWRDAVDSVFDVYVTLHREVRSFSLLHVAGVEDVRLLDELRDNNVVVADGLSALIAERTQRSPNDLSVPVSVAVEAADAVLKLAFRRDPNGDQDVLDEAKHLVKGYLSDRLGE